MKEPKFTPGPHKVKILGKEQSSVIVCSSKGRPLASLYHEKNKLAEQKGNAFLFAAATEMYNELERITEFLEYELEMIPFGTQTCRYEVIETQIARNKNLLKKARGEG
ncbi:hypothetical protein SDC9_189947 [bioreactor metagenome]|uniref:Uncharacterized protein n=1 Tax=bioreactor metagenome TaxID=1076179 RepID=A0A645HU52_9ZZZZ